MSQEFASLRKRSTGWVTKTFERNSKNLQPSSNPQAYYRSQAFLSNASINPLVAAAYPLLTIGTRLSEIEQYPDIAYLHQILTHEIRVFENQSQQQKYRQNVITIARYFLCLFLDETILQSTWGKTWAQCCLQENFHHEETSKERIFDIIDRLLSHPAQYIDLLEFVYLCLSLGLKNSQKQSLSTQFLEKLDKIYQIIREERGETSQGLLVQMHRPFTKIRPPRSKKSFSILLFLFISVLFFGYGFFCYGLKLASDPLLQQLATFGGIS